MTDSFRYPSDLISEAILEIVVPSLTDVKLDDIPKMFAAAKDRYPLNSEILAFESKFSGSPSLEVTANKFPIGTVFFSEGNRKRFEAKVNGFVFGQTAPYPGWDSFIAEAWDLWQLYIAVLKPVQVSQVGIRYINRLNVPAGERIDDYLLYLPALPQSLQEATSNFFIQTQIRNAQLEALIQLNAATVPSDTPGVGSILLDIGVYRSENLKFEDDALRLLLDELRKLKNDIFESLITDSTREMLRNAS